MSPTQPSHEPDRHEPLASDNRAALGHGGDDHADQHDHGGDALGPVDRQAWGALVLGVSAGLLVVLCLVITTRLLAA